MGSHDLIDPTIAAQQDRHQRPDAPDRLADRLRKGETDRTGPRNAIGSKTLLMFPKISLGVCVILLRRIRIRI